jgi:hypothetical protein
MRRSRVYLRATLLLSLAGPILAGCGSAASRACIRGASVACTCRNGGKGAQICSADGNSLGQCVCDGVTGVGGAGAGGGASTPADGGGAGTAGSTGGAAGDGATAGSIGAAGRGDDGGSGSAAGSSGGSGIGSGGTGDAGYDDSAAFLCPANAIDGGTPSPDGAGNQDAGTFTCPAPFVLGDFDGDGVTDCLLTAPSNSIPCPGQSILFHKGLGGKAYSATEVITPYAVPAGASGSGVDLSGDGCADLLLWKNDSVFHSTSYAYARSRCDGTFGPFQLPPGLTWGATIGYVTGPGVLLADFNGDGRMDIAGTVFATDMTVARIFHWITKSDVGNPPFPGLTLRDAPALELGSYGSTNSLGTGDFNTDGKPDIMTVINYQGLIAMNAFSEVVIGLGDGQGSFTTTVEVSATKSTGHLYASVGDFNMDGKLDLSVTVDNPTSPAQIFYGDGAAHFSTTPP